MALSPKQRDFVTSLCAGGSPDRNLKASDPELRRTLMRIKKILDDVYDGDVIDGLSIGEMWFPYGSGDQNGVFRTYTLIDNGGVGRSDAAPNASWDFNGSDQFFKAITPPMGWTLSYLESWSLHISFDSDRYSHTTREVIFAISDDDEKPFLLHLEASGAGDNAGKLVATITDDGGTERDLAWSETPVVDTDYFVTIYYDAASNLLGMSVNGGAYQTLDTSGFTLPGSGANPYVTIGCNLDTNGDGENFFDGEISIKGQPTIYFPRMVANKELSDWLYNAGEGRTIEGALPVRFGESDLYAFKTITQSGPGGTFTVDATDDVIQFTDHGLTNGTQVFVRTDDTLPAGLSATTLYYVLGTTFTADAGTDIVTSNGHGLVDTDKIYLSSSGTLPAGMVGTMFVRDSTTNTFKVALTSGGAAVDITDAGTGTHYWVKSDEFQVSEAENGSNVDITDTGTGTHTFTYIGAQTAIVADQAGDTLIIEQGYGITITLDPGNDRLTFDFDGETVTTEDAVFVLEQVTNYDSSTSNNTQILYNDNGTITWIDFGSIFAYGGLYTTFDTISSGGSTEEVVFDTAMPSSGMTVSTGGNSITIDQDGDYYVEFSLNATLGGSSATSNGWKVQLFKDGSLAGFETIRPLDLASSVSRMAHWSSIMALEATDVLTIECDQDGSNSVSLDNAMFVVRQVG